MQTLNELENITLYYREGSSDKVYQCAIESAGTRFVVNFAYGRRGSTLNTGTKTNVPVEYAAAKRIFDKLIREKQAKGYTVGQDGTPYLHTDQISSGILPQLLNSIEDADVPKLLKDDEYCAQEKFDGRRLLLQKRAVAIHGINKKGLTVGLPEPLFQAATSIPGEFVLDGECVDGILYAFDLLELDGTDLRPLPYRQRLTQLLNLLAGTAQRQLVYVDTAFAPAQKAILYKGLQAGKREGIVFKRLDAGYTVGRPNSGGAQLKHKFYATLSALVARVNTQRSVELQLLGDDRWQSCGNVTIPANHPIPPISQVVEVRYLYAFPQSGILYQPVYLGPRDDVMASECLAAQLKLKSAEADLE